jgi:hypothetical protein
VKPEAQRIAIAEWLGWKPVTIKLYGGEKNVKGWELNQHLSKGDKDRKFTCHVETFPDYCNDLNAMWQVEETLTPEQTHTMNELLFLEVVPMTVKTWHATAAQRAEALLRTIGKWQEAPTKESNG